MCWPPLIWFPLFKHHHLAIHPNVYSLWFVAVFCHHYNRKYHVMLNVKHRRFFKHSNFTFIADRMECYFQRRRLSWYSVNVFFVKCIFFFEMNLVQFPFINEIVRLFHSLLSEKNSSTFFFFFP